MSLRIEPASNSHLRRDLPHGDSTLSADDELKRRVESFLFNRNRQALRTVDVDVDQGSVVLHGRVKSFYEKQLCLSCCQRVAGVLRLIDQIEVV